MNTSSTKTPILSGRIKMSNHTSGQLMYTGSETCLLDGISSDIHSLEGSIIPGWANTNSSITNREKRRFSRRSTLSDEHMHDDSISGIGNTPDPLLDDSNYDFVSNLKFAKLEDRPEDDEEFKRYCVCRDVSYGAMIACDGSDCPYEWFHYACVSLTVAPKGRWFCPTCAKSNANKKSVKKSSRK